MWAGCLPTCFGAGETDGMLSAPQIAAASLTGPSTWLLTGSHRPGQDAAVIAGGPGTGEGVIGVGNEPFPEAYVGW